MAEERTLGQLVAQASQDLSELVRYEVALATVLGAAADAVAADDSHAARSAVHALKESDGGRAAIVLGDWPITARQGGSLPDGVAWALDLIEAPATEKHVAQHEDRPALADELQGAGDRAVLIGVVAFQHPLILSVSCVIKRSLLG